MDLGKKYWSAGKLLLSSEYVVIDGAKALAIPCKFGQSLITTSTTETIIHWISKDNNNEIWFEGKFDSHSLDILTCNDESIALRLKTILGAAKQIKALSHFESCIVETQLDFPRDWGLGSSSTLLCNIAKWLRIDPFKLHFKVSNGSGYDIACGMNSLPLIYETNGEDVNYKIITFNPSFSDHIYFIHLNKKQISDKEVEKYSVLKEDLDLAEITKTFSDLTNKIVNVSTLIEFETFITDHENLLSHILQRETIKDTLFQLYSGGVIKSLGAWGGDFILVTAQNESDLDYFKYKGYNTILKYSEMAL